MLVAHHTLLVNIAFIKSELRCRSSCPVMPGNRPILSLNRKPKSRVESALNPIDLTVLAEYHEQIESNLQRIERKNHRVWYSKPGEFGITCQGRQKVKGESIPLA